MSALPRHLLALTLLAACPSSATPEQPVPQTPASDGLPATPADLVFADLPYTPPDRASHRHVLSSGVVVYVLENHEFPLVTLDFTFKADAAVDPANEPELLDSTLQMLRTGGTAKLTPTAFDEELDLLAADVGLRPGRETVTASLDTLTANLDSALALFLDMLRTPRFDADRFALHKAGEKAAMAKRNDDPRSLQAREWIALMYGRSHYTARVRTASQLDALTVADLKALHARVFHPANLVISVTGDVVPDAILPKLEAALAGWDKGPAIPDPPPPQARPAPGVYHVEKDIPQGKVRIGLTGVKRDHPDAVVIDVLNEILGGGGFSSRLMRRIRSDEGLAYGAYSYFARPVYYPGTFAMGFDSKNRTVALALKIALEELDRIGKEPVTADELAIATASLIETFPRTFESPEATAAVLVNDEWTGRSEDWWVTWRERVRAVTPDDILRVARELAHPDKVAILVVGKWDEIAPGDLEGRASMAEFFGGQVTHLPLRDPLTQEPLAP